MSYSNFGTFLIFKPDVFSFRLLGFGVMVINLAGIPIYCRVGLKIGDIMIKGLHPWN